MAAAVRWYWPSVAAAIALRLIAVFFAGDLNLGSRPEVATPVTSLGSNNPPSHLMQDQYLITAVLIRATGQKLLVTCCLNMRLLNLQKVDETSGNLNAGYLASHVFLWNPLTMITCLGLSASPIDNMMVVLAIYGACTRKAPLAAFGWVMATHLSLYSAILNVLVVLLLGSGLDAPPKLFQRKNSNTGGGTPSNQALKEHNVTSQTGTAVHVFLWRPVVLFHIMGINLVFLRVILECHFS